MKYAIQDTYWWFDTNDYIDHKSTKWIQKISMPAFKERPKVPRIMHTKLLSEAKLYNTADEAAAVASIIHNPDAPSDIVEISDKRLFEAKLRGL
jgi:hypothetical protein